MGHLGTSPFALWGENIFCNPQLKILPLALSESVSVLLSEHLPLNPWSSRCSKELNQWEALTEYGQSKGHINPYLVLECAWRVSNWTAMKEALVQVRPLSPTGGSPGLWWCGPPESSLCLEQAGRFGR